MYVVTVIQNGTKSFIGTDDRTDYPALYTVLKKADMFKTIEDAQAYAEREVKHLRLQTNTVFVEKITFTIEKKLPVIQEPKAYTVEDLILRLSDMAKDEIVHFDIADGSHPVANFVQLKSQGVVIGSTDSLIGKALSVGEVANLISLLPAYYKVWIQNENYNLTSVLEETSVLFCASKVGED